MTHDEAVSEFRPVPGTHYEWIADPYMQATARICAKEFAALHKVFRPSNLCFSRLEL
jgi:hypothetical protein